MKKENKFKLEKFEVAKLKNLKNIKGGEGNQNTNPINDETNTDLIRKVSSNIC